MRSTGEVMGISKSMGAAFAKSQLAAGNPMPSEGTVFLSLNDNDQENMGPIGQDLVDLGFKLIATRGTAQRLRDQGIEVDTVFKVNEGRPNIVDRIINGDVHWIINTPLGAVSKYDERAIRRTALESAVPTMTTLAAAKAGIEAVRAMKTESLDVKTLQEHHEELKA
jgi:carbamoyl-phosphate synthase large subunit